MQPADPVTPPTTTQPSFGPPPNTTPTFGGSAPAQGIPQRSQHRGSNNRSNGANSGPTPPKKESPGHASHPKDDDNSPNSKPFVPDNLQLFVGNIPLDASEKALIEVFSKYGKVTDFRLSISKSVSSGTAGSRKDLTNFGFVCFEAVETVQKCLEDSRNGATWVIDGKQVKLNIEEKKPRQTGGPKGNRNMNGQRGGGDRRPMPNGGGGGGGRRHTDGYGSRPQRSGPPRQSTGGVGNQGGPAQQQQPHAQAQH